MYNFNKMYSSTNCPYCSIIIKIKLHIYQLLPHIECTIIIKIKFNIHPLLLHIECTIIIKIKFNTHPLIAYIPVPAVTIPLVPLFKQLNGSYISRQAVPMSDHQSLLANS